ncbi:MAG: hypothetical protein MJZ21_01870 [archaeon]|nr:hypothetical protein [archaeon]
MPLQDIVVKVSAKEKTAMAKTFKAILSMKEEDENVRPVSFYTPCIQGEFDFIGWVAVPPVIKESKGPSDRTFTRNASWEEDKLGAQTDNEQLFRVKDGVQQRRVAGSWVNTLGVTTGKSSIPAHIHIFGHKGPIVTESMGMILSYSNSDEYVVGVQTEFGPVPRSIKVVTE